MVALTDGSGRRFDPAKAERFREDTQWDGNNRISLATGSQYEHEELYRTPGGRWVLNHESQWQGSVPSWELVTDAEAARWLSINGHESHPACDAEFAALELA